MAQELTIRRYCDPCLDGGERVSATYAVTLGGAVEDVAAEAAPVTVPPRMLELCDEHRAASGLAGVLDALARYGLAPDVAPAPPSAAPVPSREAIDPEAPAACPVCGKVVASRANLTPHLRNVHQTNLKALGLALPPGPTRDRSGLPPSRLPSGGNTCPDCGLVSASRGALGQHVRRMHGKSLGELGGRAIEWVRCPFPDCEFTARGTRGLKAHEASHARGAGPLTTGDVATLPLEHAEAHARNLAS